MRRISLAVVVGVLCASGAYALIYLFRWEWHRAIITALFFVAAEIALGVSVLLRRLSRLEQRIDALSRPEVQPLPTDVDAAVLARIRESAPSGSSPFAWLDPRGSNMSVFLPFLLGVGAVASGLAWAVEQLARRTTAPALERQLVRRMAPLALPAGGLLDPVPAIVAGPLPSRARSVAWPLAALALVVGLSVPGIDWLGDALQTRPDARRHDVITRIDVELRGARSAARPEQAAATLWGTCSHVLHGTVGAPSITDVGRGRIELLVPTHIGPHAEERVRGCLQDAVVDRMQASVVALEAVPAR